MSEIKNEKKKRSAEKEKKQNEYGMDNEIKIEKRKLFLSMFKRFFISNSFQYICIIIFF